MSDNQGGLSVLIPNYNWDVSELIFDLHQQLSATGIPFEILCFDDCMNSDFESINQSVNELEEVYYKVNPEVLGRSENRNALTQAAQFEQLLFLDGDAQVRTYPNFIKNYIKAYDAHAVICGGTAYGAKPTEPNKQLRYLYGKKREELSASQRAKNAWAGFSAFNFLMSKTLFQSIGFKNKLEQYGHEDTLFGNELKYRCIPIKHINNPAIHLGLDTSEVFLEKSKKAVENLGVLINEGLVDEDIKLYAWFARAKKSFTNGILAATYRIMHKRWENSLCGPNPSLDIFDLYRLSYLCSLRIEHRNAPPKKLKL